MRAVPGAISTHSIDQAASSNFGAQESDSYCGFERYVIRRTCQTLPCIVIHYKAHCSVAPGPATSTRSFYSAAAYTSIPAVSGYVDPTRADFLSPGTAFKSTTRAYSGYKSSFVDALTPDPAVQQPLWVPELTTGNVYDELDIHFDPFGRLEPPVSSQGLHYQGPRSPFGLTVPHDSDLGSLPFTGCAKNSLACWPKQTQTGLAGHGSNRPNCCRILPMVCYSYCNP